MVALSGCRRDLRSFRFEADPESLCVCGPVTLSWQTPTDDDELYLEVIPEDAVEGLEPGPYGPEGSIEIEVCENARIIGTARNGAATLGEKEIDFDVATSGDPFEGRLTFEPLCVAGVFNGWGNASFPAVSDELVTTVVFNESGRELTVNKSGTAVTLIVGESRSFVVPLKGLWTVDAELAGTEGCPQEGDIAPGVETEVGSLTVAVSAECR
jgi:hypothetical protein